ncbi:GUN4 domain-containing protein [Caenorhabditis elegans]|uniref:GUN4 domain-containing protein n=1 Tax=Caenorhabditis elegans TaxID=6239 RepID=A0A0K3AR92_CAEEL|nr:GUN4 domain-containing protein [Caenorhabditis elegans]CTQ86570.1 GUN4 domain-containing protein [Caenorhabditis elegans]|eukprot:NP_001299870.1 Uncharacterized protein CELE_F35G12.5 [Caenorhabditis elegans]
MHRQQESTARVTEQKRLDAEITDELHRITEPGKSKMAIERYIQGINLLDKKCILDNDENHNVLFKFAPIDQDFAHSSTNLSTPSPLEEESARENNHEAQELDITERIARMNLIGGSEFQMQYSSFLTAVSTKPSTDASLKKEARRLAEIWWAKNLRFFPQTMYVLQKLDQKNPDGFNYTDFEEEVQKVIPRSWIQNHHSFTLLSLLNEESLYVKFNLIMPSDSENMNRVKVNQVIKFLGFHEIGDCEFSMIYQYVSSKSASESTYSIHKFMCEDFPGWETQYNNEKKSMDRIFEIIIQEQKLFWTEYDYHTYKRHAYKIAVPMVFSLNIVDKAVGVRSDAR